MAQGDKAFAIALVFCSSGLRKLNSLSYHQAVPVLTSLLHRRDDIGEHGLTVSSSSQLIPFISLLKAKNMPGSVMMVAWMPLFIAQGPLALPGN